MSCPACVLIVILTISVASAQHRLHHFDRTELSDVYYSEGANAADLNNDGHVDAIYGPFWYAGPDFATPHLIYKSPPQRRERYADHFFAWPYDFDADGWTDIFTVGFPGTPAHVYQNPGGDGHTEAW
ncbi:MAG: FG-GAP repeat domain-containing protein, partial [Verrucomicrobiales bacterium]